MMTPDERAKALEQMHLLVSGFYMQAVRIGNHPFIEFSGLMREYINACRQAHEAGIDFSGCSVHTGEPLPLRDYQLTYIQEKLDCIFCGRIQIAEG